MIYLDIKAGRRGGLQRPEIKSFCAYARTKAEEGRPVRSRGRPRVARVEESTRRDFFFAPTLQVYARNATTRAVERHGYNYGLISAVCSRATRCRNTASIYRRRRDSAEMRFLTYSLCFFFPPLLLLTTRHHKYLPS